MKYNIGVPRSYEECYSRSYGKQPPRRKNVFEAVDSTSANLPFEAFEADGRLHSPRLGKNPTLRPRCKIHEDEERRHHEEIVVPVKWRREACSSQRSDPDRQDGRHKWQQPSHQEQDMVIKVGVVFPIVRRTPERPPIRSIGFVRPLGRGNGTGIKLEGPAPQIGNLPWYKEEYHQEQKSHGYHSVSSDARNLGPSTIVPALRVE